MHAEAGLAVSGQPCFTFRANFWKHFDKNLSEKYFFDYSKKFPKFGLNPRRVVGIVGIPWYLCEFVGIPVGTLFFLLIGSFFFFFFVSSEF